MMTDWITLDQAIVLLFSTTAPAFMFCILSANLWGFHPKTARLLFWLTFGVSLTIAYPVITSQPLEQIWLRVIWLAVLAFMFKVYLTK